MGRSASPPGALRAAALLACVAACCASGMTSSFAVGGAVYYCQAQAYQVLAPVSWARRNLTLAPVDVTENCGPNAAGRTASLSITPNATQLSAANAAGAAILVPGSTCTFQTVEDYYQAFTDRMGALLSSAPSVAGVIMGEGYDGKIPELMTIYMTASGSYAYRYTAKPTCILYKVRYTQLRSVVVGARSDTDFLYARLYRTVDEPTYSSAGYYASYTTGQYITPTESSIQVMLAVSTFSPATAAAVTRTAVVNATLAPACMPANYSACASCWNSSHPFFNDTALAGAIAWVDLTAVRDSQPLCYTFGYQFAMMAKKAQAVALVVRAGPSAFAPRSKYLVPSPDVVPTFSVEYDQSQLIKQGVANGTARMTLPALIDGVGPAFYPAVLYDLPVSQLSVYVNRSSVAAFTCPMGQSLFQPAVWPGAPKPASNGSFAGVHYFFEGVPKPECNASETCAACILAGTNQMQIPSGVATLPAGAQFSVYAVGNNFPCITSYSQITDAAVAIGASSLVVILGGPNELLTTGTLVDSKNYAAVIPTFDVSYACYLRAVQAAASQLAVHVTLPALYAGLADDGTTQTPSGGGVTIGGLTSRTPPAPAVAVAPITYLLADQTSGVPLCRNGHCVAGQAQFNPTQYAEVTLNATVVFPSQACGDERNCVQCDALSTNALRYAAIGRPNLSGGLSNVIAVVSESTLTCVERGRAAMDLVALGARGVVIVMAPAFTNNSIGNVAVATLALPGLQQPLAAPTWSVSASSGAAMLYATGLRLRMPGVVAGLARAPATWADESLAVDLNLPGGIRLPGDNGAAEAERKRRVIGGAVGGLLLGGAGLAAIGGVALYFYRRRQRRYAAFNEAGGLWEPRNGGARQSWSAPPPQQQGRPSASVTWSTATVSPPQQHQNPMWAGNGGGVAAGEAPPTWALQPPLPQPVLGLPAAAPPPDWMAPPGAAPRQDSPTRASTRAAALFTAANSFDVEQAQPQRTRRTADSASSDFL